MKIAWFREMISPEIGACVAGYDLHDVSTAKLDDLYACGLCCDDGTNKVLIVSFDLLGMDQWFIGKLRKKCAEILGVSEDAVLFSCTHTHSGPETRTMAAYPELLNRPYLEKLERQITDAVGSLAEKEFRVCDTYFYSCRCDANRNRRYLTADNRATFTPHRREIVPLADGFADKELAELAFFEPETGIPLYVIGNYAAHPLAGHAPGLGGHRISADYPGAFRDYVTAETGAECMFVSGAAGDLVPQEDELGSAAVREMGVKLGKAAIGGLVDVTRNPGRFLMKDAKVGSCIRTFTVPLRSKYRRNPKRLPEMYLGRDDVELEIQCVCVGDFCFVGVPGELCCELGQEIKWHSPFRRTCIAYNSTAYFSYMGHANMLAAGGYEAFSQRFSARGGLTLLQTASDAMFDLRETVFPSDGEEKYPDALETPLVCLPPNR